MTNTHNDNITINTGKREVYILPGLELDAEVDYSTDDEHIEAIRMLQDHIKTNNIQHEKRNTEITVDGDVLLFVVEDPIYDMYSASFDTAELIAHEDSIAKTKFTIVGEDGIDYLYLNTANNVIYDYFIETLNIETDKRIVISNNTSSLYDLFSDVCKHIKSESKQLDENSKEFKNLSRILSGVEYSHYHILIYLNEMASDMKQDQKYFIHIKL